MKRRDVLASALILISALVAPAAPEDAIEIAGLGMVVRDHGGVGVTVVSVAAGQPAASAGLQEGDVVECIGQQLVESAADLMQYVAGARPGRELRVELWRGGEPLELALAVGEASGTAAPAGPTPANKLEVSAEAQRLQRECDAGIGKACWSLSVDYASAAANEQYAAESAHDPQGEARAAELDRRALRLRQNGCDVGDGASCQDLAEWYYLGWGGSVQVDYARARTLMDRAEKLLKKQCPPRDHSDSRACAALYRNEEWRKDKHLPH